MTGPASTRENETLARAFKALGNANRLRIYQEFLRYWQEGREGTLEEVAGGCLLGQAIKRLNIGAPTVSHHVRELVDAGLITTTRRGRQLYCTINPEMRAALVAFLQADSD